MKITPFNLTTLSAAYVFVAWLLLILVRALIVAPLIGVWSPFAYLQLFALEFLTLAAWFVYTIHGKLKRDFTQGKYTPRQGFWERAWVQVGSLVGFGLIVGLLLFFVWLRPVEGLSHHPSHAARILLTTQAEEAFFPPHYLQTTVIESWAEWGRAFVDSLIWGQVIGSAVLAIFAYCQYVKGVMTDEYLLIVSIEWLIYEKMMQMGTSPHARANPKKPDPFANNSAPTGKKGDPFH